jgi:hypothetical protein
VFSMNNYKFKIGDWVNVSKRVSFDYDDKQQRIMEHEDCDITGQIVGACYKKLGSIEWDSGHGSEHGDVGGYRYFNSTKSVLVWKIAPGVINIPILTTADYITLVEPNLWSPDVQNATLPWVARKQRNKQI